MARAARSGGLGGVFGAALWVVAVPAAATTLGEHFAAAVERSPEVAIARGEVEASKARVSGAARLYKGAPQLSLGVISDGPLTDDGYVEQEYELGAAMWLPGERRAATSQSSGMPCSSGRTGAAAGPHLSAAPVGQHPAGGRREARTGVDLSRARPRAANIRDYFTPDIEEIHIDNEEVFERAREFFREVMPDQERVLRLYDGEQPIFSHFNVESQIESVYKRRVGLKSGGSIVIDGTEALTAIDVNSGRSTRGASQEDTAVRTNLEAAAEIARQQRLRDLGGLIVIDFIDMRSPQHIAEVERALRAAMHEDKARHEIGRISQFGLLEISRQRLRPAAALIPQRFLIRCGQLHRQQPGTALQSIPALQVLDRPVYDQNSLNAILDNAAHRFFV